MRGEENICLAFYRSTKQVCSMLHVESGTRKKVKESLVANFILLGNNL